MSLGRLFALMRSEMQLKAIKWKHLVRSIGSSPPDPASERHSREEQDKVMAAITNVYDPNIRSYLKQLNSDGLLNIMDGKYSYPDVNYTFLRGIITEVVENSPPLSTEPFHRVNAHLLGHFIGNEEATLDEAREKVHKTTAIRDDANPTFDSIFDMGRQAYRTADVNLLVECHRAARQAASGAEGLGAAEKEVASEVARIARIMMREQLRVATTSGGAKRMEEKMWSIQAFAFGVLVAALQEKGVPWQKSPYVSVRFAETYMPDYADHIELANLLLHFGIEPPHQKYRLAGELAFARFVEGIEKDIPSFADDLARALGFL
jgi:hypothetical protein